MSLSQTTQKDSASPGSIGSSDSKKIAKNGSRQLSRGKQQHSETIMQQQEHQRKGARGREKRISQPQQQHHHQDVKSAASKQSSKQPQDIRSMISIQYETPLRHSSGGGYGGGSAYRRPKRTPAVHFNKDAHVLASYHFVLSSPESPTLYNADQPVDWSLVELVYAPSDTVRCCPICLEPPVAAKITKCGHIFCSSCILQYLSMSDRTWSRCPLCFEPVYPKAIRSLQFVVHKPFNTGDEVEFVLLRRPKVSTVPEVVRPAAASPSSSSSPLDAKSAAESKAAPAWIGIPDPKFARVSYTKDITPLLSRELEELRTALKTADPQSAIFLQVALENVKTRHADWITQRTMLPTSLEGPSSTPTPAATTAATSGTGVSVAKSTSATAAPRPSVTGPIAKLARKPPSPAPVVAPVVAEPQPAAPLKAGLNPMARAFQPGGGGATASAAATASSASAASSATPTPVPTASVVAPAPRRAHSAPSEISSSTEKASEHAVIKKSSKLIRDAFIDPDEVEYDQDDDEEEGDEEEAGEGDEIDVDDPAMSEGSISAGSTVPNTPASGPSAGSLDAIPTLLPAPGTLPPLQDADEANYYYFYQSSDGQQVYLHPLVHKALLKLYESPAHFPATIRAKSVAFDKLVQGDHSRQRFRFVGHLPMTSIFYFALVDIASQLPAGPVKKSFQSDLRKERQERERIRRENARKNERLLRRAASQQAYSSYEYGFESEQALWVEAYSTRVIEDASVAFPTLQSSSPQLVGAPSSSAAAAAAAAVGAVPPMSLSSPRLPAAPNGWADVAEKGLYADHLWAPLSSSGSAAAAAASASSSSPALGPTPAAAAAGTVPAVRVPAPQPASSGPSWSSLLSRPGASSSAAAAAQPTARPTSAAAAASSAAAAPTAFSLSDAIRFTSRRRG